MKADYDSFSMVALNFQGSVRNINLKMQRDFGMSKVLLYLKVSLHCACAVTLYPLLTLRENHMCEWRSFHLNGGISVVRE